MTSEFHAEAGEVFLAALELPADERPPFVEQACGHDPSLRCEVESLLEHHEEAKEGDSPLAVGDTTGPFRPGELFVGRYRILTLLGRGGMGEVYRAHDELLDQPVAVKILLGRSPLAVQSLLREVRLARSITHPSVCRVFDISEAAGTPFFTMEFIEGEDLASLLRRAGRLSPDRVQDLARQLLTGLAAAHAKGIVHRDLKPANILIDAQGLAHITDFGIATSEDGPPDFLLAGTPGYMAPEQWAGERADERTDLYSLALVLHEALTGHPAFAANGERDLARRLTTVPVAPSREVPGIPSAFEAVLLKALQRDRANRPASALAMAAALPRGDALSMALELGVTPPVEVVIAPVPREGISRRRAFGLLLALALGLAAIVPLAEAVHPLHQLEIEDPAVLEDRAETLLRSFGYDDPEGRAEFGFAGDPAAQSGQSPVLFWFLVPIERWRSEFSRVALGESQDGAILTVLDTQGQLVFFEADPGGSSGSERTRPEPSLDSVGVLLAAANLPLESLEPTQNRSPLPIFHDVRESWTMKSGDREFTIEAAVLGTRPVYFSVTPSMPSTRTESLAPIEAEAEEGEVPAIVALVIIALVLLPGLPLAWHNARLGRADRPGARRLVVTIVMTLGLAWLLTVGERLHPFDTSEGIFRDRAAQLMIHAAWVWVAYLAFEPLARRWWPESLVAWNRLLRGSWRDPSVGVSVLSGSLLGLIFMGLGGLSQLVRQQLDSTLPLALNAETLNAALGLNRTLSTAIGLVPFAIYNGFVIILQLVLLQSLLRNRRISVPVSIALLAAGVALLGGGDLVAWGYGFLFATLAVGTLIRSGLLTFCVAFWVETLLTSFPLTAHLDGWFAESAILALGLVFAIGVLGCRIGMARHPLSGLSPG
ncbi:MAG: serine/threonine protein kinase [Thermoanaerobaculia bacterium]|nr:serine/threonine protein kinase [Thermoanaerobaculia bacterium]